MKTNCIASETFGANGCNYFIDFKRARNNRDYLQITRSDRQADQSYKRSSVTIFEDHFYFLVESLSMLFTSAARQKDVLSVSLQDKENIKVVPSNGIKSWAPHLRPREKLMTQGRSAMSDAELLAILIGSGTTDKTAVELASEILASVDGQLSGLSRLSVRALCRFKGIGEAKALSLISAMELSDRRFCEQAYSCFDFLGR